MGDVHRVDGAARRSLRWEAAATSAFLSVFFVIVYGGVNWLTAQRPSEQIGRWYFEWELTGIPYLPLLIIPYMSCDLFFVGAPFLCGNRQELSVFRKRIVFSVLVATAFFLLMPLTLVWPPRPRVSGLFGDFVEASCTMPFLMEYPHNLFPSLHITLSTILADIYGRHTRGWLRPAVQAWLFLVGSSTMLTWQHHLVDIAGGLVLAGFALYLFREAAPEAKNKTGGQNHDLSLMYATGALVCAGLAPVLYPWGVFLLWPAAAFWMAAWAYAKGRPGIYCKVDGQIPPSATFALAPVLFFQHLSYWYYRQRSPAWSEVAANVRIGRVLSRTEAEAAVRDGVTAVVDMTAEFAATLEVDRYLSLPVLDLTAPTQDQLDEAMAFVARHAREGVVYIHCKAGYSRSAAVAAAYMLATGSASTVEHAIRRLRAARPSVVIRPEIWAVLEEFDVRLSPLPTQRGRLTQRAA